MAALLAGKAQWLTEYGSPHAQTLAASVIA